MIFTISLTRNTCIAISEYRLRGAGFRFFQMILYRSDPSGDLQFTDDEACSNRSNSSNCFEAEELSGVYRLEEFSGLSQRNT